MAHESLKAQVGHLQAGIKVLDAEVEKLEGTLVIVKADRLNLVAELESLEKFLREQEARS